MATAPFAALEARVNTTVIARLSNAVAVYTPAAGGVARDVLVIFDDNYEVVVDGMVASSGPAVTCNPLDVPAPVKDDALSVRGIAYKVVEPMSDGAGLTVLRLRKA